MFLLPYATTCVNLSLPWDSGKLDGISVGPNGCIRLVTLRTQVQQRKKLLADSLGKSGGVVDITKEYNIKHVIAAPTFLATAECICDEKFSPPVLSQYMLQVTKIIAYLCSMELLFVGVSSNLEYKHKQWDPGIIQKDIICFLKQYQQILTAKLQSCSEYVYAAFLPCRSHRAIAWGQAMFLRGGNVMTIDMDTMGRVAPWAMGWPCVQEDGHIEYIAGEAAQGTASNKSEDRNRTELSLLSLPLCCSLPVSKSGESIVPHVANHSGKGAGCNNLIC
jgi:hypothetical protein